MIQLFNAKCEDKLKEIESDSIDLCLTDLPYGKLACGSPKNNNRHECSWDHEVNYGIILEELKRIMKNDGCIALFAKPPFSYTLYNEMIAHGFKHRYNWIWKKSQCPNWAAGNFRPLNNYEEIMIFSKNSNKPKYNPQGVISSKINKCKCYFYKQGSNVCMDNDEAFDQFILNKNFEYDIYCSCRGYMAASSSNSGWFKLNKHIDEVLSNENPNFNFEIDYENKILYRVIQSKSNFPKSILEFKSDKSKDDISLKHPTQKPVELLRYLIRTYSNENDSVLDMTMGSGSTGVAAKLENRNFIGIEMLEYWFKIAEKRIEEAK